MALMKPQTSWNMVSTVKQYKPNDFYLKINLPNNDIWLKNYDSMLSDRFSEEKKRIFVLPIFNGVIIDGHPIF